MYYKDIQGITFLCGSTGVTGSFSMNCSRVNALKLLSEIYVSSCVDLLGYFPTLGAAAPPAYASDLIKSQSQRQLGQSNKLFSNANLMSSPEVLFVCPYCHGRLQLHKQCLLKVEAVA